MTNEERDLIAKFVARVGGQAQGGFSRSVPTTNPSLPPIDPEADRFIAEQFQAYPEARYRVTQMAVVQEAALAEAGNRIQQLQQALAQAQQAQQTQQAPASGQSKGFFGGLFGGGAAASQAPGPSPWNQGAPQQQYAPPPQQQYAQQPQYAPPGTSPGMFQQGGSGFLGSALTTAAGVAGGVVGANLLMDMFSGHGGGGGGGLFGGGGGGGWGGGSQPTIIENNYINQDPNAGASGAGWDNNVQSAPDPGWTDNSNSGSWDDNAAGGGGVDDSSGGGGSWDDNSN